MKNYLALSVLVGSTFSASAYMHHGWHGGGWGWGPFWGPEVVIGVGPAWVGPGPVIVEQPAPVVVQEPKVQVIEVPSGPQGVLPAQVADILGNAGLVAVPTTTKNGQPGFQILEESDGPVFYIVDGSVLTNLAINVAPVPGDIKETRKKLFQALDRRAAQGGAVQKIATPPEALGSR